MSPLAARSARAAARWYLGSRLTVYSIALPWGVDDKRDVRLRSDNGLPHEVIGMQDVDREAREHGAHGGQRRFVVVLELGVRQSLERFDVTRPLLVRQVDRSHRCMRKLVQGARSARLPFKEHPWLVRCAPIHRLGDVLDRLFRSDKKIGCNVLNRMAELGKPESQSIVGE